MDRHTHSAFDTDLEALRSAVLAMGGMVEAQILRAQDVLAGGESAILDRVRAGERCLNDQEILINQQCCELIARRQPTGIDLRLTMSFVRTCNDLERIGDEAKKVARKAPLHAFEPAFYTLSADHLVPMTAMALRLLGNSLNALARLDLVLAGSVIDDDETLDAACRMLPSVLLQHEHDRSVPLAIALDTVLVARSIERIGDHAKNIAEGVFYIVRGKDLRHSKPADVHRVLGE